MASVNDHTAAAAAAAAVKVPEECYRLGVVGRTEAQATVDTPRPDQRRLQQLGPDI